MTMARILLRRLVQAAATIFIVITIAFFLGRLSGSPAALLLSNTATHAQIEALNARLGFNQPVLVQYLRYLGGVVTGNFGDSYRAPGVSSMTMVLQRLPASLQLGAVGLLLGVALAGIAAVLVHVARSRGLRVGLLTFGAARQAVPDFFFGLLLVLVFSVWLGVLPSLGNTRPGTIVMPALTIATTQFVVYFRLLDNALSEQGRLDYARTAVARGDSWPRIVVAELLPNAAVPVMTVAGISLGSFLGGLVIVENVFAWPGLGQLMLNSVDTRDFPVVQSGLIVVASLFVLANALVDVLSAWIDPRMRSAL
jgi:peptide/nickel transport system permease protein